MNRNKKLASASLIATLLITTISTFGQGDLVVNKWNKTGLASEYLKTQADLASDFNTPADTIVRIFKLDPAQNKVNVFGYSVYGTRKEALSLKMEDYLDKAGRVIHRKHVGTTSADEFFEYNERGDQIKKVSGGSETFITQYEYESNGVVRSETKFRLRNGNSQELVSRIDFEYDAQGRKEKQFVYNKENKLEKITSFVYDSRNNLISEEDMMLGSASSYNDGDVKIAELSFEYDSNNRIVKEVCAGCAQNTETIICKYE